MFEHAHVRNATDAPLSGPTPEQLALVRRLHSGATRRAAAEGMSWRDAILSGESLRFIHEAATEPEVDS